MSWLFSRALVEEYSAGICSDGEPSAQLNVMPTPHKFWRNDKTMECSDLSRFGLTLRLLTESHGEAVLTSYLAAFPAKTFQQPAEGQESTGLGAAYGQSSKGSFARYSPDTSMWKTAQCSLLADSDKFSETWPRWGSMRNGASYLRKTWEPIIEGSEFGLWRTPCAGDGQRGTYATKESMDARLQKEGQLSLSNQVRHSHLWPTPTVCGNYNRKGASATSGDGLATVVKMWPTPTAHNAKETNAPSESERNTPTLAAQAGGSLNPNWVEWLMGWPLGWTSLDPMNNEHFKYWKKSGAAFLQGGSMREMWFNHDPATAPQGQEPAKQRPAECGSALPSMSQGGSHGRWDMGQGQGGAGNLQGLCIEVSAEADAAVIDMRPGMPEGVGQYLRASPLGYAPRTAIEVKNRVDRLKAIGNGQVPIVAATAWQLLTK